MDYLVVVLIDEIGLAEVSPHNPLKILHSLLEHSEVSVIGISNWALDASKMNRAIHLSRDVPNKKELLITVGCILKEMGFKVSLIQFYIEKIVSIYQKFLKKSLKINKRDGLYGLRDFYNIIKFVCSEYIQL